MCPIKQCHLRLLRPNPELTGFTSFTDTSSSCCSSVWGAAVVLAPWRGRPPTGGREKRSGSRQ